MNGDEFTRRTSLPMGDDEQATTVQRELVGAIAELRAAFQNGEHKTLPLYGLPDQIVVGRGTAADWQLDDPSLSRKHCQFRWNGRELTVEDLGSANGTRVGGRAAGTAQPVRAGDVVQLGTVVISFAVLRGGNKHVDEVATRVVEMPGFSNMTGEVTAASAPPLEALQTQTSVRPLGGGPPNPRAMVFRPERDGAGTDEPTREWDPRAALKRPPERNFDLGLLGEKLREAWRTQRRVFVLGGAVAWVGILLLVLSLANGRSGGGGDEDVAPPTSDPSGARAAGAGPPVVTPLGDKAAGDKAAPGDDKAAGSDDKVALGNTKDGLGGDKAVLGNDKAVLGNDKAALGNDKAALGNNKPGLGTDKAGSRAAAVRPGDARAAKGTKASPPLDDAAVPPPENRDAILAQAITSYEAGRMSDALRLFKKLAEDPEDKNAAFMVGLIQAKGAAAP